MRGRLIFQFLAELHRLDTRGTAEADLAGSGSFKGGYDPDFKESALVDRDEDGVGERVRAEFPAVRLPCQVEPEAFDALRMFAAGNSPKSKLVLVFHFADLEREGLVDAATGDTLLRPGDRLGALCSRDGALVQAIRTPPGLYATEARPIGFGLHRASPHRNLLCVTFGDRQVATGRIQ